VLLLTDDVSTVIFRNVEYDNIISS